MAKPDKWERAHYQNENALMKRIDSLYNKLIQEASRLGATITSLDDVIFTFDKYPALKKRVEALLKEHHDGVETIILNGIDTEWTLANNKNNELSRRVFGDSIGKLTNEQYRRYFSTNGVARDAFKARKEEGLNLSDRVWKYTDQFKEEIELALDLGIRSGKSAIDMTQDVKQYLQYPDKLFRRVRDEHGNLQLSKAAKAFHPGRGVYRSSYKNARRLTATETNIAYRTADYERMQTADYIVGIKICLSNNHPESDICDELKGAYPKDFKFTGWHPHCRCHIETILKTKEEMDKDVQKLLAGEPLDGESVNRVDEVPQSFKDWITDNKERIEKAKEKGILPYFLKDNCALWDYTLLNKVEGEGFKFMGMSKLTEKEENRLISEIIALSKQLNLFPKGTKVYFIDDVLHSGMLMEFSPSNGIGISRCRYSTDMGVFSPSEDLFKALQKLNAREPLSFMEEYSIESLFHESVHAKYNFTPSDSLSVKFLEPCVQLYARNNYVKILRKYRVDPINFDEIKEKGLGYRKGCQLFRPLFEKNGELQVGELINLINGEENISRKIFTKMNTLKMSGNDKVLFLKHFRAF